jgi:hypothetical protein
VDPRIHFALNCGAASCPPIRVYTPDSLDFGLGEAARAFCAGEVAVDAEKRELELSMILKWWASRVAAGGVVARRGKDGRVGGWGWGGGGRGAGERLAGTANTVQPPPTCCWPAEMLG